MKKDKNSAQIPKGWRLDQNFDRKSHTLVNFRGTIFKNETDKFRFKVCGGRNSGPSEPFHLKSFTKTFVLLKKKIKKKYKLNDTSLENQKWEHLHPTFGKLERKRQDWKESTHAALQKLGRSTRGWRIESTRRWWRLALQPGTCESNW